MLVIAKTLYEDTAKKHDLPTELVESVGNCVFEKLREKLSSPHKIAYELPKLGTFKMKFKSFENFYLNFVNLLDQENPKAIEKRDKNPELFERCTMLYNVMQEFRKRKKEVREQRYGKSESNA